MTSLLPSIYRHQSSDQQPQPTTGCLWRLVAQSWRLITLRDQLTIINIPINAKRLVPWNNRLIDFVPINRLRLVARTRLVAPQATGRLRPQFSKRANLNPTSNTNTYQSTTQIDPQLIPSITSTCRRIYINKESKLGHYIFQRVGKLAYRLDLPPNLVNVHQVFHVSMLRRYEPDPSYMINHSDLIVEEDASYVVTPLTIIDREEKVLQGKVIPLVRVVWRHNVAEKQTWEREAEMRENHPYLF